MGEDIKTRFHFTAHSEARKTWNRWKRSGGQDLESLAMHKVLTQLYSSLAAERLRSEWAFWRRKAPRFHFGRCELTPIRTNAEGISRYLGKYITKHLGQRKAEDKGIRLVRYSGLKKNASNQVVSLPSNRVCSRFTWVSPGATLYRWKLGAFARAFGCTDGNYQARFKEWFGPKWAYHLKVVICSIKLPVYPSLATLLLDYPGLGTDAELDEAADLFALRPGFPAEARKTIQDAWQVGMLLRAQRERKARAAKPEASRWRHRANSEVDSPAELAAEAPPQRTTARGKSWIEHSLKDD